MGHRNLTGNTYNENTRVPGTMTAPHTIVDRVAFLA